MLLISLPFDVVMIVEVPHAKIFSPRNSTPLLLNVAQSIVTLEPLPSFLTQKQYT